MDSFETLKRNLFAGTVYSTDDRDDLGHETIYLLHDRASGLFLVENYRRDPIEIDRYVQVEDAMAAYILAIGE